jgi:hypothetical protein
MKHPVPVIISAAFIISSCGNTETKADPSDTVIETKNKPDTTGTTTTPKPSEENIKDNAAAKSGQARGLTNPVNETNDILANIDKHLVSTTEFTALPSGGFANCVIKVTNTLPDATVQKASVEVSILKEDGSLVKTDYYTVINIESAGGMKVVKVPNSNQGAKIVTHIVKVKSNELTKGEFVLTGSHFSAN